MVGFLCILILFVDSSSSLKCSESVRSVKGKYLKGHVIYNATAAGLGDCLEECLDVPQCESINFRFKDFLCELNDANRYAYPWDYESSVEHAYSDIHPHKVTFQSLHLNMTPLWLEAHASFIDSSRFTTADQITFNADALKNAALLKVALVADGVLTDGTPLTVEITVANNASIGQTSDSDIRCGLSDGNNFIGFEMPDRANYNKNAPCYGIQAKSGSSLSSQHAIAKNASNSRPSFYPELFFLTFKLDRQWGSCFTAHGGGFNKSIDFSKRLMLSQGLTLEVYKSNKEEKVGIKYIVVSLRKNGHN